MNPGRSRRCWSSSVGGSRSVGSISVGSTRRSSRSTRRRASSSRPATTCARAQKAIQKLRDDGPLVEVPILIAVTVARLPALDFSIGFDDFVLMPIVPAELYARLRQLDWKAATFGSDEVIKIDDLVIDIAGYEARIGGRRIDLTHQEFELLRFLAQHRGRVFTRQALLERAWGYQYAGGTRTVDIHVRRVRSQARRRRAS